VTQCSGCKNWRRGTRTEYGDGTVDDKTLPADGVAPCAVLGIETAPDFGCNRFEQGDADDQIEVIVKDGAAWQNFEMTNCPDCSAVGSKGDTACQRCCGTRMVRRYGDGWLGDERTRKHPKEIAAPVEIDPGTVLAPMEPPSVLPDGAAPP